MPCFNPMVTVLPTDGTRPIFMHRIEANWKHNNNTKLNKNLTPLPCRQCIGCRLEYSRQWAMRCEHEASLYEDNCFPTLTYNNENLPKNGSLQMRDMQLFWKKLRYYYPKKKFRYYYCGEYGEKFGRPHYHAALFNLDFKDKILWKTVKNNKYFRSKSLDEIWGNGHVVLGALTFESAAYVARYATKKINGKRAKEHYESFDHKTGESIQLTPEFSQASRGKGIGHGWYQKWKNDLWPRDECIIRGFACKPPKYYDRILKNEDPTLYLKIKTKRLQELDKNKPDLLYSHLVAKKKHTEQRMKMLIRAIEVEN